MEKLREFLNSMSMKEQQRFGELLATSRGHLRNIVNKTAKCSPELAIALERELLKRGWNVRVEELCEGVDWAYIRGTDKTQDMKNKNVRR